MGTPAAVMDDVITTEEKKRNFDKMLDVQNTISAEINKEYEGKIDALEILSGNEPFGFKESENSKKLFGEDALAKVTATVVKQDKAKKIIVFKYKAKKNERKKQGHRQPYTKIKITKING